GDVSVPARLGGRAAVAHGWSSAALTPYVLSAGRPPARSGEVVTGYPAALGERLPLAATEPARTVTVVGVARPRHPVSQQTAIFLTDAEQPGWPVIRAASTRSACSPLPASTSRACARPPAAQRC